MVKIINILASLLIATSLSAKYDVGDTISDNISKKPRPKDVALR